MDEKIDLPAKCDYANVPHRLKPRIAEIENVFLVVSDMFSDDYTVQVPGITIPATYILPIQDGIDSFDAFTMSIEQKCLVCVNSSLSPERVYFALMREIYGSIRANNKAIDIDTSQIDNIKPMLDGWRARIKDVIYEKRDKFGESVFEWIVTTWKLLD